MIQTKNEEGLYNLFFHNCHNYGHMGPKIKANFTVSIETDKGAFNWPKKGKKAIFLDLFFSDTAL